MILWKTCDHNVNGTLSASLAARTQGVRIDNVVQANILAAAVANPDLPGKAMNIGCGGRYRINDLFRQIQAAMGTDVTLEHVAPRFRDVRDSQADIELAQELLGYELTAQLREGLERTLEWFKAQGGAWMPFKQHNERISYGNRTTAGTDLKIQ